MKARTNILFSSIFLIAAMTSCSYVFQRPYIATSPNVNCFEREKEKNLKVSIFVNHFDVQSNMALNKNFGLSAGLNGAFRGQIGGELAGISYKHISERNYVEIQYGYGFFHNKSTITNMPWDPGALIEYGLWLSRDINADYHKIFIQPTYFLNTARVSVGFAIKLSANYFDRYHYFYSVRDDSKGDYNYTLTHTTSDFRYKWSFVVEPAVKIEFNHRFFMQVSTLFSTNSCNSTLYNTTYVNRSIRQETYSESANPQHISFLFSIGYEFRFGKKIKKKEE